MADDYLPNNDDDLADWLEQFINMLIANNLVLLVPAPLIAALQAILVQLRANVLATQTTEGAWHGAVAAEATTRSAAEGLIRPLVNELQPKAVMTDAMRAAGGITIRKTTRTRHGVGTEVPGMWIERVGNQIIIHFGTNPTNENANSKPVWAKGCNIYRKKAGETEWTLLALDTASPYVDTITGPAISVSYRVAYRGTKETDIGPMSPEQTVAAGG